MSTTLTATVQAAILAHLAGGPSLGAEAFDLPGNAPLSFLNGAGANQANLLYAGTRTIAASSSETHDLNGSGSLTDAFGTALNFARIKAVLIKAHADNTNDVVVGNAGSNPFVGPLGGTTPTHTLKPGGVMLWVNPTAAAWAVTNSSNDQLKVANSSSGTGVTYDMVILGADS